MCSFDSSQLPHCLALASENSLTIGTIDDIQKLHIQVRMIFGPPCGVGGAVTYLHKEDLPVPVPSIIDCRSRLHHCCVVIHSLPPWLARSVSCSFLHQGIFANSLGCLG